MITDKQTLIAAVESYMHRDDASTGGQMDTWLQIAESRINERVRAALMEVDTRLDDADRPAGAAYVLPDDFIEMRFVALVDVCELRPFGAIELAQFVRQTGAPVGYYLSAQGGGWEMTVAPTAPEGSEIFLLYYAKPAALAADIDTNALLTAHPDLYLYGVLREGYTWERNADMFANADGKFNDLVEKINTIDERRRFGPSISVGSNTSYGAYTGTNGGM